MCMSIAISALNLSYNSHQHVVFVSGVYDGHGGRQIADFLEESLEKTIYQELKVDDDASIPDRLSRYGCRQIVLCFAMHSDVP